VERVAWGEKVRIQNDFLMASRQSGVAVDPTDDLLVTWRREATPHITVPTCRGLIDTLPPGRRRVRPGQAPGRCLLQAQKLMYDSAWFGYIWFEPGNFLVHNRIQGFPATWGALRESEWWINES